MKARFFCENCGKEVTERAGSCPSCGRLFTAVRCPECGFEGKAAEFSPGCPVCGYSMPAPGHTPRRPAGRTHRLPARFYGVAAIVLAVIAVILLVALLGGV